MLIVFNNKYQFDKKSQQTKQNDKKLFVSLTFSITLEVN